MWQDLGDDSGVCRGEVTLPKVAMVALSPHNQAAILGRLAADLKFALTYGLLTKDRGQAARLRSLNVKFGHCPGCHIINSSGNGSCEDSRKRLPVCLSLFSVYSMGAHLIVLLACHEFLSLNAGLFKLPL